jgi:GNAT superfamily N-acetyltransferase
VPRIAERAWSNGKRITKLPGSPTTRLTRSSLESSRPASTLSRNQPEGSPGHTLWAYFIDAPTRLLCTAPLLTDLDEVAALVSAAERADLGEPLVTKEDTAAEWAQPNSELDQDAIVLIRDERIVAAAETYRMRAEVHIHPDFRGLGLGTWLLRWVEARGRSKAQPKTRQPVLDQDTGSAEMLRSHGYTIGHVTWIFEIAFDEKPAEPRPPKSIEIRGLSQDRTNAPCIKSSRTRSVGGRIDSQPRSRLEGRRCWIG